MLDRRREDYGSSAANVAALGSVCICGQGFAADYYTSRAGHTTLSQQTVSYNGNGRRLEMGFDGVGNHVGVVNPALDLAVLEHQDSDYVGNMMLFMKKGAGRTTLQAGSWHVFALGSDSIMREGTLELSADGTIGTTHSVRDSTDTSADITGGPFVVNGLTGEVSFDGTVGGATISWRGMINSAGSLMALMDFAQGSPYPAGGLIIMARNSSISLDRNTVAGTYHQAGMSFDQMDWLAEYGSVVFVTDAMDGPPMPYRVTFNLDQRVIQDGNVATASGLGPRTFAVSATGATTMGPVFCGHATTSNGTSADFLVYMSCASGTGLPAANPRLALLVRLD